MFWLWCRCCFNLCSPSSVMFAFVVWYFSWHYCYFIKQLKDIQVTLRECRDVPESSVEHHDRLELDCLDCPVVLRQCCEYSHKIYSKLVVLRILMTSRLRHKVSQTIIFSSHARCVLEVPSKDELCEPNSSTREQLVSAINSTGASCAPVEFPVDSGHNQLVPHPFGLVR